MAKSAKQAYQTEKLQAALARQQGKDLAADCHEQRAQSIYEDHRRKGGK